MQKLNRFNITAAVLVVGLVVAVGYFIVRSSQAASADINGDGRVNISDLSVLAAHFGQSGVGFAQGDITGDGKVNILDLSLLAANWGSSGSVGLQPPFSTTDFSECPAGSNAAMVALVNHDRSSQTVSALTENSELDFAARTHAIWMGQNNSFSHGNWAQEIIATGYPGTTLGQNIAENAIGADAQFTPTVVEAEFFNETAPNDGHRLNILNPAFHNIGIACASDSATGETYWVQNFGN